ncbi:MAG: hypothetical protein COA44_07720 [Arcobacter sp.]|nr:MAG: hypothetical protein COA44_07720 [Arcobacter sp.]
MQVNNSFNYSTININEHKKNAEDSLSKISSGKTKQLDDAALALIANSLGSDISGLLQGLENANSAVALSQIADGVLSGLSQGADDLNVLAVKAGNPTLNGSQREILQNEADGISQSLQNSVDNASYNGESVFGRSFEFNLSESTVSLSLDAFDISSFDIHTQDGIAAFVKSIQNAQIEVGSTINQLSSATNSVFTQVTALSAAKSQISDTDIAQELISFEKETTQLSASLIAQAHSNELSAAKVERLLV